MKRQTVMIVDDTPANIEILSESLGDDYELFFATSGLDALELIRADKPDLILLDIMMPGMDGFELCGILKGDPSTRDIPIIFVTAMIEEEQEIKGLELGAIDYLTKPISPHIVRARVKNHLELKRYRDLLETLASAADRAKKEFLRSVSHELRTPLTPIIGMTDFVLNQEEDDNKRKYLGMVQKSAVRLLGIVEDLIETSRLEGEGGAPENAAFHLKTFLDMVLMEARALADGKGLDLNVRIDPMLPEVVVTDQGMLHKVLTMLLGNAVKFTPSGAVGLEARLQEVAGEQMLQFSVTDTGVGIDEADLERIFSDFTQSDGSITRSYPGLGLGLTLARRMTELMDGGIWAENLPGGGSVFQLQIPLVLPQDDASDSVCGS
ncbi:hybrid sensor histidine kinase/response regulator [Geomonas subterranea]|uniref:histidine kinase n=1 Tax=Geomonas subterranea TaxID=2847989 RepID=A0ABX8LCA1_9BACT|nr:MULTISPECIES: hybrid sensor histidine kinase/response regulator [Geomonas]QXE89044.1 hybrid sensor histidine kinase/response regulator [Geomonas subterranea]QXM08837.1 hybrid sensor histidine kinase/response regulator [Geomonas subterranea]